jgi:hypothetical protein
MIRQQTLLNRGKYLNHLIDKGSFTFDEMVATAEDFNVSRNLPYHIKNLGMLGNGSNGKLVLTERSPKVILNEVFKLESQRNKDAKEIRIKKKKTPKDITNTKVVFGKLLSEYSDQDLIDELKRRGYGGDLSKSFKL